MKVHVLTTGGTIDKVYFDAKSEFQVGPPMIAELLKEAHVTAEVTAEPVLAKDSLDMSDADRQLKHGRRVQRLVRAGSRAGLAAGRLSRDQRAHLRRGPRPKNRERQRFEEPD